MRATCRNPGDTIAVNRRTTRDWAPIGAARIGDPNPVYRCLQHSYPRSLRPWRSSKMDFNDIKNQVSNLTLYDIKAGWRKAQNGKIYDAWLA